MFNKKKRFFKAKIDAVTKNIWDLEFKVEKTLQVREGVRQDRDKMKDAQFKIETELKTKPNDKKLTDELAQVVDTINRYEKQMKMLDDQINGVPAHEDNPGENGINDTISSLAELRKMYQDYLRKI